MAVGGQDCGFPRIARALPLRTMCTSGARPLIPPSEPSYRRYWQKTLRLTGGLLVLWFLLSFVLTWFAPAFTFRLFGLPFSHWLASQGVLLAYCAIIWGYAIYMNRLDREHGVDEGE
jgi:putative solute:sodium symporter small subunit